MTPRVHPGGGESLNLLWVLLVTAGENRKSFPLKRHILESVLREDITPGLTKLSYLPLLHPRGDGDTKEGHCH